MASIASAARGGEIPHGTTVVALKYADGVVMAGDRRVTTGHSIANRTMEKVFQVDRFSAVSIAGAAGPAQEMVRLFQTQVDYYEKIQGRSLSLEGKANQLAQMVRNNFGAAVQFQLVVVPIFAGYDVRRKTGRIFTYDITGSRTEEADFDATGSGGRDARTTIKLGWREGMARDDAVELAIQGLYEAADEDTATGGPDVIRGIYPMVSLITADGYRRVEEPEVAERFGALIQRKSSEGHRP
jgi:proteasome beta subunit